MATRRVYKKKSTKTKRRHRMKGGNFNREINVFRINFSHADYNDVKERISAIRSINEEYGYTTGILADLQGPKLRVGEVLNNGVNLKDGNKVNFTTNKCISDEANLYINYDDFAKDVNPGEHILVDDGKLMFEVLETNRVDNVVARVIHGGVLSSKKGVNLPNTKVSLPCLTEKDLIDLGVKKEKIIIFGMKVILM